MGIQQPIVDDESGVSPVIGVILMVAVTVIIAAVIGSTALGLGDEVSESPPTAQFDIVVHEEYEHEDGYTESDPDRIMPVPYAVEITHGGGESIDPENLKIRVNGEPALGPTRLTGNEIDNHPEYEYDLSPNGNYPAQKRFMLTEEVSAGDSMLLFTDANWVDDASGADVVDPLNEDRVHFRTETKDSEYLHAEGERSSVDFPSLENYTFEEGDEVTVIWESPSSGNSHTLAEHTIK